MAEQCVHWWLIGDLIPGQAANMGTCKLCGETRVQVRHFAIDTPYNHHPRETLSQAEREIRAYVANILKSVRGD